MNPIDVFHRLYSQPHSFLLDSCGLNRYSFAGANPFVLLKAQDNKVEINKDSTCRILTGSIFSALTSLLNEFNPFSPPFSKGGHTGEFGFPFQCGAVGYFGYELKNQLERLPEKRTAEPNIPDCILGLYDTIFAYDHKINKGYVISSGLPEKDSKTKKLLAKKRMKQFLDIINQPQVGWALSTKKHAGKMVGIAHPTTGGWGLGKANMEQQREHPNPITCIKSNFTKDAYMDAIKQAQGYIASGDIYQANLSQRLTMDFHGDPLLFYSQLRKINPAQFGAFLNYREFQVISNSPERLLKLSNGIAETCPIKGTRPRGKNPKEDKIFIEELKQSCKELAEHIMIVDLERNDLGKICEYGSIKVRPLQRIDTYATLHHMISTVKGKIKDGITPVECIKSVFPGGSVTGAPKIRAMEIIEELESAPRGIYTGAIGYMDFRGNMDLSMAIRTAVLKDNRLYLNVGGGIVADSNPEAEYEETMLKASAFFKAIKMTGEMM
ncbi:MAG: aminodeoxychorismate synthase component I [Deltaproteobacteria bacterium]|nr:aminodeoxychorismate synthase component I [Deltaproteobacteria bacterium]